VEGTEGGRGAFFWVHMEQFYWSYVEKMITDTSSVKISTEIKEKSLSIK
jgi:hypothetical protein